MFQSQGKQEDCQSESSFAVMPTVESPDQTQLGSASLQNQTSICSP